MQLGTIDERGFKRYRLYERWLNKAISFRNLTLSDGKSLPSALLLGEQKAGTTAVFNYLERHPDVRTSIRKEIHFFSRDSSYNKGKSFYKRLFHFNPDGKIMLEGSTGYLYLKSAPSRVLKTLGAETKFLVVIIRNPIERAYSAWNMFRRLTKEKKYIEAFQNRENEDPRIQLYTKLCHEFPSFNSIVEAELDWMQNENDSILEPSFIRRGFYSENIKNWIKHFPRENFHFIDFEQFKTDNYSHMSEIARFIGITEWHDFFEQQERANKGQYKTKSISSSVRSKLESIFSKRNIDQPAITGIHPKWISN